MKISKQEWEKIVAEWPESGLTAALYCQKVGVAKTTFYAWRKICGSTPQVVKAARTTSKKTGDAPTFLEVVPEDLPQQASLPARSNPTVRIVTPSGSIVEFYL